MTTNNNNLILNNMNLAYKVAWKYYNKLNGFIELEEIQSLCYIGLIKASKLFDETKECTFSTYAYKSMQNEILTFFNKTKHINSNTHISLSQEIGDNLYIEDTISSMENIEEIIQKNILINKLYKFIDELDDLEKKIVLAHLDKISNKKLEEMTGLKHARINAIYRKAINKLRYKFYKERSFENE